MNKGLRNFLLALLLYIAFNVFIAKHLYDIHLILFLIGFVYTLFFNSLKDVLVYSMMIFTLFLILCSFIVILVNNMIVK